MGYKTEFWCITTDIIWNPENVSQHYMAKYIKLTNAAMYEVDSFEQRNV